MRHFLRDDDISVEEQRSVLEAAARLADNKLCCSRELTGRTIGLIFEKPSLRTRVSSETAAINLGAYPVLMRAEELHLKRGESALDSGKVLAGYLDLVMARVLSHKTLEEFKEASGMPVVNGLSDRFHPLQSLADLLTLRQEWEGSLSGRTIAFIGDGNNVCASLMLASSMAGINFRLACPKGFEPPAAVVEKAAKQGNSSIKIVQDPFEAVTDADVIYTDVWTSMGQEHEERRREVTFAPFQVNEKLLRAAPSHAIVLHCLPAHKGREITSGVFDGPQSRVFRQAHNRLPATAALFLFLLKPEAVMNKSGI